MNDITSQYSQYRDQMIEYYMHHKNDDHTKKISMKFLNEPDPNDVAIVMAAIKKSIDQYKDDALINEFNQYDALWAAPDKPKISFGYILLWVGFGIYVLSLIALIIFSIIYS